MNPKKPRASCKAGCGAECKTPAARYCSMRCRKTERVELFLRGEYPASPVTGGNGSFLRNYLIERCGERCERCGWSQRHAATGRVPLELEHLDGDWRNVRPHNLIVLCRNCHALTPTYGARNKGRGREVRALWRRRLPTGLSRTASSSKRNLWASDARSKEPRG